MPNKEPAVSRWYVGCVRSCQEKKVAQSLERLGVEYYLPIRRELHRWSDRRKLVECLLVPRFIFIRCADRQRPAILSAEPRIWRFLASDGKPEVVRDTEMDSFRKMVENGGESVKVSGETPAPGDRVRVMSGPLAGMECELVSVAGGRCLAVRLGALGTATMDLDILTVQKI